MKKIPWIAILVLVPLVLAGCAKKETPGLKTDVLLSQIEFMAQQGYQKVDTLSASGSIKARTSRGSGTLSFIMVFDPEKGMRIEVVDPFYRPLQIILMKKRKQWVHDPQSGRTSVGSTEKMLKQLTGISLAPIDFQPILLGRLPQGDLVANPSRKQNPEGATQRFELRQRNGLLVYAVEMSSLDGKILALDVPRRGSEKTLMRAEYQGMHDSGIPRRVKIIDVQSGDFVLLRYTDLVSGEKIDENMFNPPWLQRLQ